MNLLNAFSAYNRQHILFGPRDIIIVAISGGVDSVVLAHLFQQLKQPIRLAHVNFQLRGPESERDEAFVRKLADQWQLPLDVARFDTTQYAREQGLSIQVAARQLRYQWFDTLVHTISAAGQTALLATAHQANDSVETMLHHLFRGTGIEGMHGILPKHGYIIRPLLFALRQEVEQYAEAHQLAWVEDSSNLSEKYARNYIRHTIIPAIEQQYPTAVSNMVGSVQKLSEAGEIYRRAVNVEIKKLQVVEGEETKVPLLKLRKSTPLHTIVYELFKTFGFGEGQVPELIKLMDAANGAYVASATHRVILNRAWLLIAPVAAVQGGLVVIHEADNEVICTGGRLQISCGNVPPVAQLMKSPAGEAWVDASQVQWPLILRPWRAGDYFYPLGMHKKKKLARFFADIKLSKTEKEKIWVLESNKRIIWITGYRLDDRFRIANHTEKALHLKYTPVK